MRSLCLLVSCLALGCAGPDDVDRWLDASPDAFDVRDAATNGDPDAALDAGSSPNRVDAAALDAALLDAALLDATVLDRDAAGPDTGPAADAMPPAPGWGPCAVRGTPGVCVDVAECDGVATPGFCPGPAEIQCCTAEAPGEPQPLDCDPDAHPQPNAGASEAPGLDGCPPGMLGVDAFCIDRFEAALVEVLADGSTRSWSPYHNPGRTPVRAVSIAGAVPQGYIDGRQAADACAAAGKRLCTDGEWLRACRWTDDRTYPYGDGRMDGLCNDARGLHPAIELFPDDPTPFDRIQHPCINQLADGLAPTGSHPACVTPEGVFDMMGNLHEWTADPTGTFRGGFYVDTVRNGQGCLYRTTAHGRGHWDYSTGFRCCAGR